MKRVFAILIALCMLTLIVPTNADTGAESDAVLVVPDMVTAPSAVPAADSPEPSEEPTESPSATPSEEPTESPSATPSDGGEDDYTYFLTDGCATITGYSGAGGDITLPDSLGGYPVIAIGDCAFNSCSSLTSVTIGSGVETIGYSAFACCSNLTSVTIGNGVKTIGENAFRYCSNLTSVTIGSGVTMIGEDAFYGCDAIASIEVAAANTAYKTVQGVLFDFDCTSILLYPKGSGNTTFTIPNTVTSIGASAFSGCSSLTSVTIGNGVKTIGENAFYSCSGLTAITIPDSVTSIESSAFEYCSNLTSVTIGNGVKTIGENAFRYCSNLTSVTIGSSVTMIGENAFYGCDVIASIEVDAANTAYKTVQGALFDFACTSLLLYPKGSENTTFAIPNTVTSIGASAFSGCSKLTSVTIGNSVETIGHSAFAGCRGLTAIEIPDSVTSIGGWAFGNCSSLTTVTIGSSVETIGEYAFYSCRGLTAITIPDSVTSIGGWAFENCSSLTTVTIGSGVTMIGENAFYGCDVIASFEVDAANTAYKTVQGALFDFACTSLLLYPKGSENTTFAIPNTVTSIGASAFSGCSSLTSVTIGSGVETIGEHAFYSCSGLTAITIPDSVTSIGYSAFRDCSKLTTVTIGSSVTMIGENAFYGCDAIASIEVDAANTAYKTVQGALFDFACTSLLLYPKGSGNTTFTIPDTVTSIGASAFSGCSSLTSVTIGSSVETIGGYAFYSCSGLTAVTIPDSVTSIGIGAFCDCSKLTTVTIGSSVETIGEYAFYSCSGLTAVTIPDSVTAIGGWAFVDCRKLTTVTIGSGVTMIGENAFDSCRSLTAITIPDSVTSIESSAFEYCSNLTSVTIGNGVTMIGENAFYGCDVIASIEVDAANTAYKTVQGALFDFACTSLLLYPKGSVNATFAIPNTVTSIGGWAFGNCSSLTTVTIGSSVETIGGYAFYSCSGLTAVTIPDSVTSIGIGAFRDCSKLTTVTIGSSVETIGEDAFYSCSGLTAVTIGSSVETIGEDAFYSCSGLTAITIPDSVTSIGYSAFRDCSKLTTVTIGSSVETIGEYAFYSCSGLTAITIPDSVTSIGYSAFRDCSKLTTVTIGSGVTMIGEDAFYGCDAIASIEVDAANTAFKTVQGALFDFDCTSLLLYPKGSGNTIFAIPDTVTSIGASAFSGCSELTSVTIGSGIKTIGAYAFAECGGLSSLVIPNNVTAIGDHAFESCYTLQSISFPNSVTSFGSDTLNGCASLTELVLPEGVTSIRLGYCVSLTTLSLPASLTDCGFWGCKSLTYISVSPDNPNLKSEDGILFTKDGTRLLKYPPMRKATSYTVPEGTTCSDFEGCIYLEELHLQDVSNWDISDCPALTTLTIESGSGFLDINNCPALTDLTIPEGVNRLWLGGDLPSLTNLSLPTSLDSFYFDSDYWDNSNSMPTLRSIQVADGNETFKSVDGVLFSADGTALVLYPSARSATAYSIPEGVTRFGYDAFCDVSALTELTLPTTLLNFNIETNAFPALRAIRVTEGNTSFKSVDGALLSADGTEFFLCPPAYEGAYTMPEGVVFIGYDAFDGCSALTSLTISSTAEQIDKELTFGCSKLAEINVTEGSTSFMSVDGVLFTADGTELVAFPPAKTGVYAFPEGVQQCDFWEADIPYITELILPSTMTSFYLECCALPALTAFSVAAGNTEYKSVDGVLFTADGTELIGYPPAKEGAYTVPDGVSFSWDCFTGCVGLTALNVAKSDQYYSSQDGILLSKDGRELMLYPAGREGTTCTIPDGVEKINEDAFIGVQIDTITFVEGTTSIQLELYHLPNSVQTAIIPKSVERMDFSFGDGTESERFFQDFTAVYFYGEPPSGLGASFHTYGEDKGYFYRELSPTLYYLPEYADAWAPNGETTYCGLDICMIRTEPEAIAITGTDGETYYQQPNVDSEDAVISNLPPSVTVEQLSESLGAVVTGAEGRLKTGDIVTVGGEEYTIVITGDTNSDGYVTATDAARILRAVVGQDALTDAQAMAADARSDGGVVSASDAVVFLRFIVGIEKTIGATVQ